jgi:hypothetical protein
MPRWVKILLIIGASGAVLLGLAIGGVVWWFNANSAQLREKGLAAETEGKEYGLGKSSHACVDESFTRLERTSGIFQRAALGVFLKGCLEGAPRDPDLCVGVPATNEILQSGRWRNGVCAARGKLGDDGCFNLIGMIQEVCHPKP